MSEGQCVENSRSNGEWLGCCVFSQVLIHGNSDATTHLAEHCGKNNDMEVKKVYTPCTGETVDATRESHIYQVYIKYIRGGQIHFCLCPR